MRFLPIVTQIFLWGAVFAGMEGTRHPQRHIAGYSYEDFIAYYLLTMISRAFSSMPGLASGIARVPAAHSRRPQAGLLCRGPGAVRGGLLPVPRVFHLLPGRGHADGLPRVARAIVPAGLLPRSDPGHDRLLVPGGELAVVRLHAVQFLPVKQIPLQYLAYFPAAVFLGKIKGAELAVGLLVQVAWVALFYTTARMAFHYGVRRYSSFGG